MGYDPTKHHRQSLRLQGYDYASGGAYFVTICTQGRACLFGDVLDGDMRLNDAGRLVLAEWGALPDRFPVVELDAFVVMPNHVHGIVFVGAPLVGAPMGGIPCDRATTRVAPTGVPMTGAPMAGAPGDRATPMGVTTAGVPMADIPNGRVTTVGAPLVGAPIPMTDAPGDRATTRVAPTGAPMTGGAPMADAPMTGIPGNRATTVGNVVGAFKSLTTVRYVRGVKEFDWPPFPGRLWQRNYYEHIIRDDRSLNRIRRYILDNPARWAYDRENPYGI